ncbi:3TM-type holin [Niveispirillum lacus]|nr:3TM-type holin [Niveispirillum lacus]
MLGKVLGALVGGGAQAMAAAVTPFTGDRLQDEASRHGEMLARFQQYGVEFADRQNRTGWDSFIDGLNRLPRPAMALGVIGMFVWASADPAGFAVAAQAWALIPEEMWIVLGAIITFFFGDRTLLSIRRIGGPSAEQVAAVLAARARLDQTRAERSPDPAVSAEQYDRAMADPDIPLSDEIIQEWNRRRGRTGTR